MATAAGDWFHESQLPLWLVKQAEDQMRRWEAQAAAHAAAAAAQAAKEAAAAAALDAKGSKGEKRAKEAKAQAEVCGFGSCESRSVGVPGRVLKHGLMIGIDLLSSAL
jgi:hypothetical protein